MLFSGRRMRAVYIFVRGVAERGAWYVLLSLPVSLFQGGEHERLTGCRNRHVMGGVLELLRCWHSSPMRSARLPVGSLR